jgi:hypothetical protein
MGSRSNNRQIKSRRLASSSAKDDRTTNIENSNNKENQITDKSKNKNVFPEKLFKQISSDTATKHVEIKEEVIDYEYGSSAESV